jgi:hypothetical protein
VTRCVTRCDVARRHIRYRSSGSCGCAARQRQRHADDSQHRYGFLPTLSLRSLLRLWHSRPPRMPSSECSTPVALFVRLCKGTLQGRIRTLTGHSLQAAYRRTGRSTSSSTTQHPVCSSTSRRPGLSWLKQVASWFSILKTTRGSDRCIYRSLQETYSQHAKPFVWTTSEVHRFRRRLVRCRVGKGAQSRDSTAYGPARLLCRRVGTAPRTSVCSGQRCGRRHIAREDGRQRPDGPPYA